MSKKRQRNAFVDGEAEEDSGEESDSEKKQRAAAMKKLKSSRPSRSCFASKRDFRPLGFSVSEGEDDEDEEEMDEDAAAEEFKNFIAEPEDEVR